VISLHARVSVSFVDPRPMAEAVQCSSYALVGRESLSGMLPPGEDFFPRCIETHRPAP
jgi:hypothetical protein